MLKQLKLMSQTFACIIIGI